jgi:DNA polymerase IV
VSAPQANVLHADLDAFYASVEQRDDPSLRGRPVIVGGGVVMAASYEAKARGVRTAMGGTQAKRLCPDAVVVPCRFEAYTEASKAVFKVFEDYAPVVEALSIDEAFLDVRGLEHIKGTPRQVAERLRRDVLEKVGLPITVGVARTKFLAKVASGVAKPDGLLVVEPDRELEFLHPLPVERLWGVGKKTGAKLRARGITLVSHVAERSEADLIEMVGRAAGRKLHALSHGRDARVVERRKRRRSMGAQRGFGLGSVRPDEVDAVLVELVERVMLRMRKARRVCRTVVLRMRFGDYTRATRSHTMGQASAETDTILATARDLVQASMPLIRERGLTLVGISLTNLDDGAGQLALPVDGHSVPDLDATVDRVHERFGKEALTRGVLVGRDLGSSIPMLPD